VGPVPTKPPPSGWRRSSSGARTHVQHVMEAIAYNLKMLPSLEKKREAKLA
jgi:hypothetical protein